MKTLFAVCNMYTSTPRVVHTPIKIRGVLQHQVFFIEKVALDAK